MSLSTVTILAGISVHHYNGTVDCYSEEFSGKDAEDALNKASAEIRRISQLRMTEVDHVALTGWNFVEWFHADEF